MAFIRSKIFAQSFLYAKNVKLMTDNTRPLEGEKEQYYAGANFIKGAKEYLA